MLPKECKSGQKAIAAVKKYFKEEGMTEKKLQERIDKHLAAEDNLMERFERDKKRWDKQENYYG